MFHKKIKALPKTTYVLIWNLPLLHQLYHHCKEDLKYHIDGHEIVSNKWTKKYLKKLDKKLPKKIKPRNPFFTNKGELRKPVKERMTAHKKGIHKLIARHLKK